MIVTLCLFAFAAASASSYDDTSVVVLTDKNFDTFVLPTEPWIIEFYAPWCGACKNLQPIWEKAGLEIPPLARVGAVDATVNSYLAARFAIKHYPTVFFVFNGKSYEYEGPREVSSFVQLIKEGYKSLDGLAIPGPGEVRPSETLVDAIQSLAFKYPIGAALYISVLLFVLAAFIYIITDICCNDSADDTKDDRADDLSDAKNPARAAELPNKKDD